MARESVNKPERYPGARYEQVRKLARKGLDEKGVAGELQKHSLALWLIFIYASIAVASWAITCRLTHKPIQVPGYFDQTGSYTREQYQKSNNWRRVAKLGQSIASVLGIPITSAICTEAAVVYCQRRDDTKEPRFTIRQMLALADRGWADSATLFNILRPSTRRRITSALLLFSSGLVCIGKSIISIRRTGRR